MELNCAAVRAKSGRSFHFRDNNPRKEKPLRLSPGLSEFSGLEGYLRVESSAENLGNHFLVSLSFFGVLRMEEITPQPVFWDAECGCKGGIRGSSGEGVSIGTSDGDGAVDGRLRMGRGSRNA